MSQLNNLDQSSDLTQIAKILSSLANEDAIKIFIAARGGIVKSTTTIDELGLTQKRYYTRLNELITNGLVEKKHLAYRHTMMGTLCYFLGKALTKTLGQLEHLNLADRLRTIKSLSPEDTKQILQAISNQKIVGSFTISDLIQPIKLFNRYEDVVTETVSLLDNAEHRVHLATGQFDSRVIEAIMKLINRDIECYLLTSKETVSEKYQLLQMLLAPKFSNILYDFFNNEKIHVKATTIPYGFSIIDEKSAVIEILSPFDRTFYFGLMIQNEAICQKLLTAFRELYRKGDDTPLLGLVRKKEEKLPASKA